MNWPADLSRLLRDRLRAERDVVLARRDARALPHPRAVGPPLHGDVFHGGGHAHDVAPINFATLMAFLAWFGGTGYLLTVAVPLAGAAGARSWRRSSACVGAVVVFWVMAHVLWSPDENMQSADYHMVGVLGRVSQPIREGGTGELIYSHGGARHSCGARSADGRASRRRGSGGHGLRPRHRLCAAMGRSRGGRTRKEVAV